MPERSQDRLQAGLRASVPQLPSPGVLQCPRAEVRPGAQGRLPGAEPPVLPGGPRQGLPAEVQACLLPGAQDPDQGGFRAQVLHRH